MNNIYKNFIQILVITIVILLFMKICQCIYEPFAGSIKAPNPDVKSTIKAPTPDVKSTIKTPTPVIKSETPPTSPTVPVVSTNNYNVNNLTVTGQLNLFPSGMIAAFAGSSVPTGWTLCDGANGTPDLTGQFIVGAGQGSGLSNRPLGSTGGEISHNLSVAELGTHTHPYNLAISVEKVLTHLSGSTDSGTALTNYSGTDNTGTTGGGLPHNNIPPYYVLAYIMKL